MSALKNLFLFLDQRNNMFINNYFIIFFVNFIINRASTVELTNSFGWKYPKQQDLPDFSREFRNYINIVAKVYLFNYLIKTLYIK
jgi:hypothetical protein